MRREEVFLSTPRTDGYRGSSELECETADRPKRSSEIAQAKKVLLLWPSPAENMASFLPFCCCSSRSKRDCVLSCHEDAGHEPWGQLPPHKGG